MSADGAPSLARPLGLAAVVAMMAVAVFTIGNRLRHRAADDTPDLATLIDHGSPLEGIATEVNSLKRPVLSTVAGAGTIAAAVNRNLAVYYGRRAYAGAPPRIPHVVAPDAYNATACNVCHERGGYVAAFTAYAPVSPHPEYGNCLQCHVETRTEGLFVESQWLSVAAPPLHRPALPGGPPPMPHSLQLRDNCLACHAGPAVPLEIRTPHPERINCVQCHVSAGTGSLFARIPSEGSR
jgi:cytochrome c-type protein NapB